MPAYKDQKRGTWYCQFYYVDWTGKRKKKKRGFARKKDAEAYEEEFLKKGTMTCDMTFDSMVELYMDDMRPRLRATTMRRPHPPGVRKARPRGRGDHPENLRSSLPLHDQRSSQKAR